MKSLILTTMTVLSLSVPALADARMDAYETCWSSTATKVDQSMKDYDKALDEAVARANKICHALARKAAVACCRFFGHEVKLIPPWFQNRLG